MTKLSVNINKLATLRNARGGNLPDIIKSALECERFGAQGITVHPRPDGRHIKYSDVTALKPLLETEFNIEGYPSEDFMNLVTEVRPDQVTLVPDPPEALTSNSGWDTIANQSLLKDVVATLKINHIRVSIFTGTDLKIIEHAAKAGADRIELYTEPYALLYPQNPEKAVEPFKNAASHATKIGLQVNAGHDLNLENLQWFAENVHPLDEVSIGHALICDAIWYGMENTIQMYRRKLFNAKGL
jgi:pyridoxine 5-phosphate synthase